MKGMRTPKALVAGVSRRLRRLATRASQVGLFWARYHDLELLERFNRGFAESPSIEVSEDPSAKRILKRVAAAFERAKYDQRFVAGQYAVGPMWEGIISRNFGELLSAVRDGDQHRSYRLLESFHRQRFALSAGGSYDDYQCFR